MTDDARPGDLISIVRAAAIAERSERTIRRWASADGGKLQRWEGQPPVTGGPAPVLVSERQLMELLATSGQEPRLTVSDAPDTPEDIEPAPASDMAARSSDTVQVVRLQGRLEAAELRAQIAALRAERDGLARLAEDLRDLVDQERRRWELERADHRTDLEAERERSRALEHELRATRALQGVPWWRKMLGGPVAPTAAPETAPPLA